MFISIGGLLAAATTINGIFMATPRDLLLYGKDKILPVAIGDINKRFGTPHWAIALTLVVGLAGVSLGMQIEEYALFTVMCFMLFDILVVIGLIRLTRRMPYLLDKARWKLGRRMQWFVILDAVVCSSFYGGRPHYNDRIPTSAVCWIVCRRLPVLLSQVVIYEKEWYKHSSRST